MAKRENLEQLTVDIFLKKKDRWQECNEILDSNASSTCGSLQNHAAGAKIEKRTEQSELPKGF